MTQKQPLSAEELLTIALAEGLTLQPASLQFNDTGLDFQVAFATDSRQREWILRIPRRADVIPKAKYEHRVLQLMQAELGIEVPDWKIFSEKLIAYPRLSGTPVALIDMEIMNYAWHIDPQKPSLAFLQSFGSLLAQLHGIALEKAASATLRMLTPEEVKAEMNKKIAKVREEIGTSPELSDQWTRWIEDTGCWPAHSVCVHGDIQAAHILVDKNEKVNGILDWTEAAVGDPANDFVPFLMAFGEENLEQLIRFYEKAGGKTWPGIHRHIKGLRDAFPVAIGIYALETGDPAHMEMARQSLGL